MGKMFACGWVLMLTAQQKQALARHGRWRYRTKMVQDFIFCMVWAVLLWLWILRVSGGLVRYYIVLGFLGGAACYQWLCRRRMERVCSLTARALLCIWKRFCRVVSWPWRMLYRLIWQPCIRFLKKRWPQKQEFASMEENNIENGE